MVPAVRPAESGGCAPPGAEAGGEPRFVLCRALGLSRETWLQDSSFAAALGALEERARARCCASPDRSRVPWAASDLSCAGSRAGGLLRCRARGSARESTEVQRVLAAVP